MMTTSATTFSRKQLFGRFSPDTLLRNVVSGAVLLVAALFAGCATGDYAYVMTISSGERIHIPLEKGSPAMASSGDVTIAHAALIPTGDKDRKEVRYLFALIYKANKPVKSIHIEDVSEEKSIVMLDDQAPEITNHKWSATSKPFTGEDAAVGWIAHLDNTMRVFQFTITATDGTKTVLNQGWMVPGWAKVPMRFALGMK